MKRVLFSAVPILGALCLVVLFAFLSRSSHIDVLAPAGEISSQQRQLLTFTLLLSGLVVIPVFTLLIFISVKYRAGNKRAKYSPEWGENKWLEGLWWGIPIFIIGILAVVTYQTSHSLDPHKQLSGTKPITVQVVALQWKWLFLYPQQNVATLNYLAVPVNAPVTFKLTANAPMSAFWIPALGSQTYAMNGMASDLNLKATKAGEYTGYTTNINGAGYATMKFKAKAMSQSDFDSWLEGAKTSKNVMTMDAYHSLSPAKSETDERTYRLQDTGLFDEIVGPQDSGHMMHHEGMSM